MSKECGDHGIAFGLCNGLEVVFLGNRDHHHSDSTLSPLALVVGARGAVKEQTKDEYATPAEIPLFLCTTLHFTYTINHA